MNIPIFIISRDRLSPLLKLVNWLEEAGHDQIFIIDNASTFPPLLDFYSKTKHQVLKLNQNIGHTSPWDANLIQTHAVNIPFVVTDPDVVPSEECPKDLIKHLWSALEKYPQYRKAGVGLRIDDLPSHYPLAETVRAWESQFWKGPAVGDFLNAPVDTTFAMHRPNTPYLRTPALRSKFPYVARHLSWYANPSQPSDEDQYYSKNVKAGVSHWGTDSISLNLGCCDRIMPGYINVDRVDGPGVTKVDLCVSPWPWADSSVSHIYAQDVIEHLPDKIQTMNEAWRVLKPGGTFHIGVPTTDGTGAFQDPTHVSYWNRRSFLYYEEGNPYRERMAKSYGISARFRTVKEKLDITMDGPKLDILLAAVKS